MPSCGVTIPIRPDSINPAHFAVKEVVSPGEYTLYAFEDVPDGAWTDAEFLKGIKGKGV